MPATERAMSVAEVEAAGGYEVVYADPPWHYSNRGRGAAENHYRVMSPAELAALPVSRIAARNSVLFLWATWPQMPEALELLRAWGFKFKTCAFVWVKYHEKSGKRCVGGGFWTRANTEFCLLGTRGKAPPRRVDPAVRQLIEAVAHDDEPGVLVAPRGEHSSKPEIARERIVRLMGDLPRVELFARERAPGWDAWGDQVPGGSDVELVSGDDARDGG